MLGFYVVALKIDHEHVTNRTNRLEDSRMLKVFIGSSTEANEYLLLVYAWIEKAGHKPVPWNDHKLFLPGEYTFPKLIEISRSVDAAVFIFSEDDKVWYREDSLNQPRDNVLMEYGIFSGAFGHGSAIICKVGQPKIPTDIHGLIILDISEAKRRDAEARFRAWLDHLDKLDRLAPSAHVKVFEAPAAAKYNHKFYDHFRKVIRSAKQDIYITGEGFECADSEGKELAESFIEAFKQVLKQGISVVRIQTRLQTNNLWASLLADLLAEYPDRFQLYALKKEKVSQMSSVCVIDPENSQASVVEIMLSTQRLFGTTAADLAGTAVFIERQEILARDLRSRILSLTNPQISVRLTDPGDALSSLCGAELYFAYGSNMLEDQMKGRCNSAVRVGIGMLNNYELVFNRKGTYRAGGVASIKAAEGHRVYGVIWRINSSDFWDLDEKEDPKAYVRKKITITTLSGDAYACHLYESIPQGGSFKPDKEYLKRMIRGGREAGLSEDYIRYLESFKD